MPVLGPSLGRPRYAMSPGKVLKVSGARIPGMPRAQNARVGALFGPSGGPPWGLLGPSLGRLGALLGACWGRLGSSGGPLDGLWRPKAPEGENH